MTAQRKFTQKDRANIAREERDYMRFCILAIPASGDLTTEQLAWMASRSVHYFGYLAAIVDTYEANKTRGASQGDRSPDEWETWFVTLTEDQMDKEAERIALKMKTEVIPWIAQKRGKS